MSQLNSPRRSLQLLGLLTAATFPTACSPKNPCNQIKSTGQSVVSWAATAQMVAQRWAAGNIPTAYARNTLAKGAQQVRRTAANLGRSPTPASPVARSARARYEQLADTLAAIETAIARDNTTAVAGLAARLPILRQQLGGLETQCRAQERAS